MSSTFYKSFYLTKDIKIDGIISCFSLVIRGKLILTKCNGFSYINNVLFVTKSGNSIYVFSTNFYEEDGEVIINILATFSCNYPHINVEITIADYVYVIDSNGQIITNYKKSKGN